MSDEKLIKALQERDETAMDRLIAKYAKLLWKVVSPILHKAASVQDMEECVADTFIYLWQYPEKYDAARGSLKSYLALIARSKALDRYRALSRRLEQSPEEGLLDKRPDLAQIFIDQEDKKRLALALQSLSEQEREIVLRRYYYEQKPREIARALDLPVKQVDNHLYRAKQKLRELISD